MEGTREVQKNERSEALTMQASYRNFVEYGKVLIGRIERNQLELARLCYRVNQELSQPGFRTDLDQYKNYITSSQLGQGLETTEKHVGLQQPKTFRDFCDDVGISKSTAYRALAAYNAEEDRLYTKEEMKQLAEAAWNALCEEIHEHRTNGEPLWTPEKWGKSAEFRYEMWLVEHGYMKPMEVKPTYYGGPSLPFDGYPSFGPFALDFIDSVERYCVAETSGDGAIRFFDMCQRYKSRVPKGIKPNDVLRIPVLVRGAISLLPKEARRDATILVANILRDYVEDEV